MVATDKLFVGKIPEIYDRLLVPLLFESYARDLAERVANVKPQEALETAAGTGVLTREIASRIPAHARVVATDLNQPMLDHAAAKQPPDSRIIWQQADALALPFEDQRFDVVACQFGVMFFPDKVQSYRETLRVLKPGGHFLFNTWDRIASRPSFHKTHPISWPEPRMAISKSSGFAMSCLGQASPRFRSRQGKTKAELLRRMMLRLPTAKELR